MRVAEMVPLHVLLLTGLFCGELQAIHFSGGPDDGDVIYTCSGSDVELPWQLQLDPGDKIADVHWYYHGSSEEIIGGIIDEQFVAFPTFSGRVTEMGNAGITISYFLPADSGNYSVMVTASDASGQVIELRRSVAVHATDNLMTQDGRLHISQKAEAVMDVASGQWAVELRCGTFLFQEDPPYNVEWTTPGGQVLNSSSYTSGQFSLLLTSPDLSGNYTCRVLLPDSCLQGHDPNNTEASLFLDDVDVRLILLEKRFADLAQENEQLFNETRQLAQENLHMAQDNQQLFNETQHLAQENQQLFNETRILADENQQLAQENQQLSSKTQELAQGNQMLFNKTQELAQETHNVAQESHQLAQENQQLLDEAQKLSDEFEDHLNRTDGVIPKLTGMEKTVDEQEDDLHRLMIWRYNNEGPCHPGNHTVLDEAWRATSRGFEEKCDDHLAPGWYRFLLNGSSAVMPTTCPPHDHCGTWAPYWLNLEGRELPPMGQRTVARACGNWQNNCCKYHQAVTVQHCGDFYVYRLQPPDHCYIGYCVESA